MDENKLVSQTQRKNTKSKLWIELEEAGFWKCLQGELVDFVWQNTELFQVLHGEISVVLAPIEAWARKERFKKTVSRSAGRIPHESRNAIYLFKFFSCQE